MKFSRIEKQFNRIVGENNVIVEQMALEPYQRDWCQQFKGQTKIAVLPTTTQQAAEIVRFCYQHQLPLIPAGGRTGLSGGMTPVNGEIILSLEKIRHIENFCPIQKKVTVGAGLINHELQQWLCRHNLMWPIHLASSGSCQIGGNLSTNAGGVHVIRYGHARRWCLGMTFVDGTGVIHQYGHHLIKNNSGYDYSKLLIGAEGTLGVITEATLQLVDKPQDLTVVWLSLRDLGQGLAFIEQLRCNSPYTIHACEFLSHQCLEIQSDPKPPSQAAPYYLLISLDNTASQQPVEDWLAALLAQQAYFIDAVIASSEEQANKLWRYREEITVSIAPIGLVLKNDISVPIKQLLGYLQSVEQLIKVHLKQSQLFLFGHLGDGNVHVNLVFTEPNNPLSGLSQFNALHGQLLHSLNGSLSAEHGIGLLKKEQLKYMRSATEIDMMRRLKLQYDPGGILNPGKILSS